MSALPMSIEKIARVLDPGAYASLDAAEDKDQFRRMYSHIFDGIEAKAARLLPLLSDKGWEAGAEAMREMAARRADGFSNATGRTIARDIRTLPLPPLPHKESTDD